MTVRVKICGITSVEDALDAVDAGADAIGLNFWTGSKRRVSDEVAAEIAARIPARVLRVGVFVNQPREAIARRIAALGLGAVQLHGDEPPECCVGFDAPVIKAFRCRAGETIAQAASAYAVDYVLLDADAGASYGGTGRTFPWELASGVAPGRLFLAGGLRPDNVAEAVRRVRPYAVDVAGGVERAPGQKDRAKVREFVKNAKDA